LAGSAKTLTSRRKTLKSFPYAAASKTALLSTGQTVDRVLSRRARSGRPRTAVFA